MTTEAGHYCREHWTVLVMQIEDTPEAGILGYIDRAISRSRDPAVAALGKIVSGALRQAQQGHPPSIAELQEQLRRLRQQQQSQQRPPGAPPPPRPSSPPPIDPEIEARRILGFEPADRLTREMVVERKRALAKVFHPDLSTGSVEQMKRVNLAADVLLAKLP